MTDNATIGMFLGGKTVAVIAKERRVSHAHVEDIIRHEWTKERVEQLQFLEELLARLTGTEAKIDALERQQQKVVEMPTIGEPLCTKPN